MELLVQGLQGEQVGADVFADGGVWAAAGFDGADAVLGEGFVASEEFGVFSVYVYVGLDLSYRSRYRRIPPGEDIIRHSRNAIFISQRTTQRQHQGCLSRSNGTICNN